MNAAAISERTSELLVRFNLTTAAAELACRLEQAGQQEALRVVLEVLEMEAEAREQRKIARLRRASQLPPGKTFDTLDLGVLPPALGRKLREVAGGDFLEGAVNLLAFGAPGVGKSTPPARSATRWSKAATRSCSVPPISWCRNCSPPSAI